MGAKKIFYMNLVGVKKQRKALSSITWKRGIKGLARAKCKVIGCLWGVEEGGGGATV